MAIGSVGGSLDSFPPGQARLRKGGVTRRCCGEGIIAPLLSLEEGLIPGNKLAGIIGDHIPKQRELLRLSYVVDLYCHMRALQVSGGKQLLLLSLKGKGH